MTVTANPIALDSWPAVREFLRKHPSGTTLRISRHSLPNPLDKGALRSTSLPVGQSADYCWRLAGGVRLHVREYPEHYEVQYEKVKVASKRASVVAQAVAAGQAAATAAGLVAAGALVGGLLSRSKSGTLVGAGIGAVVAGIALLDTEAAPSPDKTASDV